MRQKRAQLQEDAKPLPVGRTVSKRRGSGFWSAHRHGDLALKSSHHQLAAARGNGEERGRALAMAAPHPFDKRRVGWSVLVKENHFTSRFRCRAERALATAPPMLRSTHPPPPMIALTLGFSSDNSQYLSPF